LDKEDLQPAHSVAENTEEESGRFNTRRSQLNAHMHIYFSCFALVLFELTHLLCGCLLWGGWKLDLAFN
jgi:hypothetical protein